MDTESNKRSTYAVMERGFNQGDLSVFEEYVDPTGFDHQESPDTNFIQHLKEAVTGLRTAFPDLHFEIHDMVAEGDLVAFRSTMTGTHTGLFSMMPGRPLAATGRQVAVPHMHFIRYTNGKTTDLWHVWNTPMMMMQLGAMPQPAHN